MTISSADIIAFSFTLAFLYATLTLHRMLRVLNRISRNISHVDCNTDLIRIAAESIDRKVGTLAAPIIDRKGKRFARWLRVKWPLLTRDLANLFSKHPEDRGLGLEDILTPYHAAA